MIGKENPSGILEEGFPHKQNVEQDGEKRRFKKYDNIFQDGLQDKHNNKKEEKLHKENQREIESYNCPGASGRT